MLLILESIPDYLVKVLSTTGMQLFILLGPLLLLAFLMNFVSSGLSNAGFRIFGRKGFIYGFKWIGTPVHELGHTLFAILFAHRITGIKFFDPDAKDGSFGSVSHSYKSGNLYQEIGNFFIGIGPVLMCSASLYLITWLLFHTGINSVSHVSISADSFYHPALLKPVVIGLLTGFQNFVKLLFTGNTNSWWKIILFLYLQLSIGSSITLSISDIKSAIKGFFIFVIIMLLFNLFTLWIGNFTMIAILKADNILSDFYFVTIIALIFNVLFLILLGFFVPLANLIRGKIKTS